MPSPFYVSFALFVCLFEWHLAGWWLRLLAGIGTAVTVTLTMDMDPGGNMAMTALGKWQGHGPGSTKDPRLTIDDCYH